MVIGDREHFCVVSESCRIAPRDHNPDYEM